MGEFIRTYAKEIISLIIPFLTWILNVGFKPKARLFLSVPHTFTFLITDQVAAQLGAANPQPSVNVFTASYTVRNGGKDTATKIEVVFNYQPQFINIWPTRHHEIKVENDRRYVLIFDSLSPGEAIGIEVLSIKEELPILLNVRCDQCVAETMALLPQPVYAKWQQRLAAFLVFSGIAAVIYVGIITMQFLVLRTPLGY